MYDENGMLKPEYALTDAEKREFLKVNSEVLNKNPYHIEPNNISELNIEKEERAKKFEEKINTLKEQCKKYLDSMKVDVLKNKIFYNEFSTYFTHLKMMIDSGLIIDYLDYAIKLSNASVMILTDIERESYKEKSKELEKYISKALKHRLSDKKIDLKAYFEQMKKAITIYKHLTIKEYINYCKALSLAISAELDSIDCLEIARLLDDVKVEASKEIQTYDETNQLNYYRKIIKSNIKELEEKQKGGIHM